MNNIFYAPPEQISDERMELTGQEAHHAINVLRYQESDMLTTVDGLGNFYQGVIRQVNRGSVVAHVEKSWSETPSDKELVLGLAIIKKRDRLEFAVEKAVELGVREIILFPTHHTEKNKVRMNRLETIALGAMKQSLRAYKPEITVSSSIHTVLEQKKRYKPIIAQQNRASLEAREEEIREHERLLLLIGPEGGFSEKEVEQVLEKGGEAVSLGTKRLRAETAAITLIARFASPAAL